MKKLIFLVAALVFSVEAFPLEPSKPSKFVFLKAQIPAAGLTDVGCSSTNGGKFKDGLTGSDFQIPKNNVFVITQMSWKRTDPDVTPDMNGCAVVLAGDSVLLLSCDKTLTKSYGGNQNVSPGVFTKSSLLCVNAAVTGITNSGAYSGEAYLYGYFAKDK